MKKLLLLIAIIFISCESETEPDCDCDRVQPNVTHFSMPDGSSFGGYTTKNDCSGEVKTFSYTGTPPQVGSCK